MTINFPSAVLASILVTGVCMEPAAAMPPPEKSCAAKYKLCVGVRSDARPFSYKPWNDASDATRGPLRKAGYGGYIVKICDAVLAEMLVGADGQADQLRMEEIGTFDIDEVTWKDAAEKDRTHSAAPLKDHRFGDLGQKFDILCDPATITGQRQNLNFVSPPLFLTGISYISQKNMRNDDIIPQDRCMNATKVEDGIMGVVGATNAPTEGIQAILNANELPKYRKGLISFLRNRDAECLEEKIPIVKKYETHVKAAAAFCENRVRYYVGDLEIIAANIGMIPGCDYDGGVRTFTNDRYAIFGRAVPDGRNGGTARQLLVAKFFEILSQKVVFNPSILDKAFDDTFVGVTPSRKLDLFFWSVRGEEVSTSAGAAVRK